MMVNTTQAALIPGLIHGIYRWCHEGHPARIYLCCMWSGLSQMAECMRLKAFSQVRFLY